MEEIAYWSNVSALAAAIVCLLLFGVVIASRRAKTERGSVGVRSSRPWLGLILQGVAFMVVWSIRRHPSFSPLIGGAAVFDVAVQILSIFLSVGSLLIGYLAVKELGRQWSLQARLLEGHKLIRSGVYGIVRHPIYTAMLGLLIAIGLAISTWWALLMGVIVFFIATKVRTHEEEKLLIAAFGDEFTDWKAKVPPLIPFLRF